MYREYDNHILKIDNNNVIPKDESNRDYREYLKWVLDGGTAEKQTKDPEYKINKLEEVNRIASNKINTIAPLYKQMNMLARALELSNKIDISVDEQLELDKIQEIWDRVKNIRAYSNEMQENVKALVTTNIHNGWPE